MQNVHNLLLKNGYYHLKWVRIEIFVKKPRLQMHLTILIMLLTKINLYICRIIEMKHTWFLKISKNEIVDLIWINGTMVVFCGHVECIVQRWHSNDDEESCIRFGFDKWSVDKWVHFTFEVRKIWGRKIICAASKIAFAIVLINWVRERRWTRTAKVVWWSGGTSVV